MMEFDKTKMSLGDEVNISEKPQSSSGGIKNIGEQVKSEVKEENAITEVEMNHNSPVVLLLLGMAGSGKTTLTQRLVSHLMAQKTPPYTVNLDPACREPPFPVNIDIRDTVDYKKVMKQYNLGPNGAIVTSLNLFTTKFDQVLEILKRRCKTHKYILIDTPGQIEVFMWSASGQIITECLAALFPTVIIYVTDLVTNVKPLTFISNMSYACSILYKTKLPLVITLNKCDQVDPTFAIEWIEDCDAFEAALAKSSEYSSNLASSLALVLDDFYKNIEHTVVSAIDGFGMQDFFASVLKAVASYETEYKPMCEAVLEQRKNSKGNQTNTKEETTCFSVRATGDGGGAGYSGLSLSLDNDDEVSSEEDDANAADVNEEDSFPELYRKMAMHRIEKEEAQSPNLP